jgi:hypothetical protein
MTDDTTATEPNRPSTNWAVQYDVEPIEIRDPVAAALGVLEPGAPLVVTYQDVVKAAGHSCATASGAYRMTQLGLAALYPDELPVRSEIDVRIGGPRDDAAHGVMGRLISYITGAAEADGFGGLAGGYGNRRHLLTFDAFEPDGADPTVRLRRTDVDETVEVTYHVSDVPDGGPAMGHLRGILEGAASDAERRAFNEAWHGRVRCVLSDDELFAVEFLDD